jgi:hypothetical protein
MAHTITLIPGEAQQGRAQGADHDAGRQGLHQRQRRPAQGARPLRQPAARCGTCRRVPPLQRRRPGRSSARTPRTSTPASSTSSSPASSRASRSSPRRRRRASRASPSSTRGATGASGHRVHKANIMKLSDGLFLDCAARSRGSIPTSVRRAHRRQRLHAARDASPSGSTCCCCRTSTATSSRTSAPAWSAGLGVVPARTSARSASASSRRCTARAGHRRQNIANPTALLLRRR